MSEAAASSAPSAPAKAPSLAQAEVETSLSAAAAPSATAAPEESPPPGWKGIPPSRPKGFPGVPFKTVRGFAFDMAVIARPVCEGPLDPDGTLCSTVSRPGVELSAKHVDRLLAILGQRSSYGAGSSCFLPHHGFVFYDEAGAPVAEVSVCFLCDMAMASPWIPQAKKVDGRIGLSEKGNEALRELCRDVGLPKCDAKVPEDFDPKKP